MKNLLILTALLLTASFTLPAAAQTHRGQHFSSGHRSSVKNFSRGSHTHLKKVHHAKFSRSHHSSKSKFKSFSRPTSFKTQRYYRPSYTRSNYYRGSYSGRSRFSSSRYGYSCYRR